MKLKCSSCGKRVPVGGKVCPWCNADKSEDQTKHALLVILPALVTGVWVGVFGLQHFWVALAVGILLGITLNQARKRNAT